MLIPLLIHPAAGTGAPGGPYYNGELWDVGATTRALRYPVPIEAGDRIVQWIVFCRRDPSAPRQVLGARPPAPTAEPPPPPVVACALERLETVSLTHVIVDEERAGGGLGSTFDFAIDLRLAAPLDTTDDDAYCLRISGNGIAGILVGPAIVYVERAAPAPF